MPPPLFPRHVASLIHRHAVVSSFCDHGKLLLWQLLLTDLPHYSPSFYSGDAQFRSRGRCHLGERGSVGAGGGAQMELGRHSAGINGDGGGWWACGTGRRSAAQGGRHIKRSARGRRREALRSRSSREKFLRATAGGRIPRPTPSASPLRTDADYSHGIRRAIGVPEMHTYFRLDAAGALDWAVSWVSSKESGRSSFITEKPRLAAAGSCASAHSRRERFGRDRMKQFRAMNEFQKSTLRVIAGCLWEEEIKGLKEMFKSIDKDNNGMITLEELKNLLGNIIFQLLVAAKLNLLVPLPMRILYPSLQAWGSITFTVRKLLLIHQMEESRS